MKQPLIEINDFKGGMTLNEKMGRADQFHFGYGLDFSSKPGYLTAGYGWKEMLLAGNNHMPTEFQSIIHCMKNNVAYAGGEDTKIYKVEENSISEAVDSDQAGAIRSMIEYKDYMLYIQNTTIGTSDLAATPTYNHIFKTGLTDADHHPFFVSADNKAYFGHGRYVGNLTDPTNAATVTLNALDLSSGWNVRALCDFGYLYLAIGASYYTSTYQSSKSKIFLWNRADNTWNDEIIIPEKEIKAMIFEAGYLWIWAGRSCNLYVVPEGSRKATKMWSFVKENPTEVFEVYPNAVVARNGTIYFGLSGVKESSSGKNPAVVYSFPAEPANFSLNVAYRRNSYDERFKSLGLVRGASGVAGDMIYMGFRNYITTGSEYNLLLRERLYASDDAPYYSAGNFYQSFRFEAPKNKKMLTEAFGITFDPLPAGTTLYFYYKKDGDDTLYTVFESFSTANASEKIVYKKVSANSLKLYLDIRGSATTINRPFVKSIYVTGHLMPKIR